MRFCNFKVKILFFFITLNTNILFCDVAHNGEVISGKAQEQIDQAATTNCSSGITIAKDNIKLMCGVAGGCIGTSNQLAENKHTECSIKAIFSFQNFGVPQNITKTFKAGEKKTVTYCNCGTVKIVGASYVD